MENIFVVLPLMESSSFCCNFSCPARIVWCRTAHGLRCRLSNARSRPRVGASVHWPMCPRGHLWPATRGKYLRRPRRIVAPTIATTLTWTMGTASMPTIMAMSVASSIIRVSLTYCPCASFMSIRIIVFPKLHSLPVATLTQEKRSGKC